MDLMAQKRRIGLASNKCCSLNITCCGFRFSTKHPHPRHPPPHPPPHVFHLRINIHHHSIHHHDIHNHHQLFILTCSTSVSTSTTTASTTTSSSRVNQLVYLPGELISLSVERGEGSLSSRSGV
ncbi:hypothetical protein HID58_006821 [Brassica napus]|uniref:Uncharacterized protein n=1 Tax=Brassica napus TaxID=3708 RepID=A0ABQ8ECL4_BRANA|nr:hypothetical protein HID58_006821 [Brassica napus]